MVKKPTIYAAFLRGLNVGGKGIISMATLKGYFESLGFTEVVTYINSGNVVFQSTISDERKLERSITKALLDHFDHEVKAVVIDIDGIDELLDSMPKSWKKAEADDRRDVIFLRHTIDKASIVDDIKTRDGVDSLTYVPRALLWSAPKSMLTKSAMSRLTASPSYKDLTIRTLGTVQKVQALMHKSRDST